MNVLNRKEGEGVRGSGKAHLICYILPPLQLPLYIVLLACFRPLFSLLALFTLLARILVDGCRFLGGHTDAGLCMQVCVRWHGREMRG